MGKKLSLLKQHMNIKVIFALMALLSYTSPAFSGTAIWTGKQTPVSESTGYTVRCEYAEGPVKFWRLANDSCEPSVKSNNGGVVPKTTDKQKQNKTSPMLKTYP